MGAANFAYVLLLGLTGAGCYMSLPLPVVMVGQASLCVYIGSHLSASSDSIKVRPPPAPLAAFNLPPPLSWRA